MTVHVWRISACPDHRSVVSGPKYAGRNGRMPVPVIIASQCPHCVVTETVIMPEPKPEPQGPGMITQLENAVVVLEEIAEPKAWARKAAFTLARVVRAKLR